MRGDESGEERRGEEEERREEKRRGEKRREEKRRGEERREEERRGRKERKERRVVLHRYWDEALVPVFSMASGVRSCAFVIVLFFWTVLVVIL